MAAFLRTHRRRAGLTLEALADRTGLTKSYLSKIERGLSTPSIAVALAIADALDTDVSLLFSDKADDSAMTVERRDERAVVDESASAATYDPIATRMRRKAMQPFIVHPTTEPDSPFMEHSGEEFIFVRSGAVEVTIPNQTLRLDEGDSLYFHSDTPHRVRSISTPRATLLVVVHDRADDGASTGHNPRPCGPTA